MAPVSGATPASHPGASWQLYLAEFGSSGWPATGVGDAGPGPVPVPSAAPDTRTANSGSVARRTPAPRRHRNSSPPCMRTPCRLQRGFRPYRRHRAPNRRITGRCRLSVESRAAAGPAGIRGWPRQPRLSPRRRTCFHALTRLRAFGQAPIRPVTLPGMIAPTV